MKKEAEVWVGKSCTFSHTFVYRVYKCVNLIHMHSGVYDRTPEECVVYKCLNLMHMHSGVYDHMPEDISSSNTVYIPPHKYPVTALPGYDYFTRLVLLARLWTAPLQTHKYLCFITPNCPPVDMYIIMLLKPNIFCVLRKDIFVKKLLNCGWLACGLLTEMITRQITACNTTHSVIQGLRSKAISQIGRGMHLASV